MDDYEGRFDELLQGLRTGDTWAVTLLYRKLNAPLLRYLSAQESDEADDLASDAWLGLAPMFAAFKGDESDMRALLFTIARRRLLDLRRKRRRHQTYPTAPASMPDRVAPDDPEAQTLESESTARALDLIGKLPPDQREVILLRVVAGLDVEHTATVIGKRPGTVRVLAHRGLKNLQSMLSDQV
ncbi:MAG TPA: sigma-70 family RNA polymerase sigma factor [Actinomycetota bacterium]|nr:sigma-70 family RNA polymerase sigma factor [Actinomycetota bacterium]